MILLVLGIALWFAAHLFKRVMPERRAAMGDAGKGLVALMLFAVWVFGSSEIKGGKVWPATRIRHPQLTAVKIWALAHLLVNGDLASIILFGGMMAWAVVEVIVINKAEPDWTPPPKAPGRKIAVLAVITAVVFAVVAGIHIWLGVWPFPS